MFRNYPYILTAQYPNPLILQPDKWHEGRNNKTIQRFYPPYLGYTSSGFDCVGRGFSRLATWQVPYRAIKGQSINWLTHSGLLILSTKASPIPERVERLSKLLSGLSRNVSCSVCILGNHTS
jgi:hypothetical protein